MTKNAKRQLQCGLPRPRRKYIRYSVKMAARHRMCRNMGILQKMIPSNDQESFRTALNKLDDEHIEIKKACEGRCRKIKNNTVSWFLMATVYGNEL